MELTQRQTKKKAENSGFPAEIDRKKTIVLRRQYSSGFGIGSILFSCLILLGTLYFILVKKIYQNIKNKEVKIEKDESFNELSSSSRKFVVSRIKSKGSYNEGYTYSNEKLASKGYFNPVNLSSYDLPKLQEVEELYGDRIVIHGSSQCKNYRASVPAHLRYMAPAGLHNTGTNTVYKLLQRNCYIPERWPNATNPLTPEKNELFDCTSKECGKMIEEHDKLTGIRKMVPWWKHAPASFRDNAPYKLRYIEDQQPGKAFDRNNVLPIVMIKDPVTWISSMCRNSYEVKFPKRKQCPKFSLDMYADRTNHNSRNLVVFTPPLGKKNNFRLKYNSIVGLWGKYYHQWMDAEFPSLIVRYEDLLFFPEETITEICHCGGGKMRDEFQLVEGAAKNTGVGAVGGKKNRNDLIKAAVLYGHRDIRDSILSNEDKIFVKKHLDHVVLDRFDYSSP